MDSSILRNTLKYATSSVSSFFLLILLICAGRYLGADDFGRFSFAMAFVLLFDFFLDPGLYHLLIREIARDKENSKKYLSHALTWKLTIMPFVFLMIFLSVNVIHDSQKTLLAVYLMAIAAFLKSFKDPFRSALLAHEFFGLDAILLTIERFLLLVFGSLVLITGKGLIWLCSVFVAVRVIDNIVIAIMVRYKICKISIGYDLLFLKFIIRSALPIGAFYITINIYNYVDTVLISILRSDAEVGWYNAGYRIYEGLMIVPVIIGTVLMPRLSRIYKIDNDSFTKILFQGIKYIFILALFISANGVLFSDKIITIFFGVTYAKSILALNILLAGLTFVFILNILQTVMITMDKQKIVFYIAMLGLIINIVLNLILIPRFGYYGAAFATVLVEFLILILFFLYIHKIVSKIPWWSILEKPAISLLVPVLFVWFIMPANSVYLKCAVINLGFIISLYLMKVFEEEEIGVLLNLFPFRKRLQL